MKGKVVVLDPPYQNKQASYNDAKSKKKDVFDYQKYWDYVRNLTTIAQTVIVFDTQSNIKSNLNVSDLLTRKMRVNGKYDGDLEAMCILGERK